MQPSRRPQRAPDWCARAVYFPRVGLQTDIKGITLAISCCYSMFPPGGAFLSLE